MRYHLTAAFAPADFLLDIQWDEGTRFLLRGNEATLTTPHLADVFKFFHRTAGAASVWLMGTGLQGCNLCCWVAGELLPLRIPAEVSKAMAQMLDVCGVFESRGNQAIYEALTNEGKYDVEPPQWLTTLFEEIRNVTDPV